MRRMTVPTALSSSSSGRRTPRAGVATVLLAALTFSLCAGCAHVPPEAVKLSYQIGQDLPRLHESYDQLIHDRFDDFRARRNGYVDEVWSPTFLSRWIERAKLVETAKGEVVWSFENKAFVAPTAGKEKVQLLATVREWSRQALAQIEKKRRSLLDPLDQDEQELRRQVREAFTRVIEANAYVTAHLASLRHVEEAQDEALQALRLKDLRDSINVSLTRASARAITGLEAVRKADSVVTEVTNR